MKEINWQDIRFRASSWGNLMSEPKEKAAKDRGELGLSCQKELLKNLKWNGLLKKEFTMAKKISQISTCMMWKENEETP